MRQFRDWGRTDGVRGIRPERDRLGGAGRYRGASVSSECRSPHDQVASAFFSGRKLDRGGVAKVAESKNITLRVSNRDRIEVKP